jgi:TetR/AcrR family fatty acid metabolism transcriptional regulator
MLDAAARLFAARRFHEVRMDDVAAEAGVSKGTVYRYFEDKEELYFALLDRATRETMALVRGRAEAAAGARERLVAVVDAIVGYFDAQPHLFDLIQRAEARRDRGGKFPWQRARDENLRLVREAFAEGERRGEFTVRDPEHAALMLLAGLRGVTRFGPRPRPADLAERLVDDFLFGAACGD